jgi:hypothetical protein
MHHRCHICSQGIYASFDSRLGALILNVETQRECPTITCEKKEAHEFINTQEAAYQDRRECSQFFTSPRWLPGRHFVAEPKEPKVLTEGYRAIGLLPIRHTLRQFERSSPCAIAYAEAGGGAGPASKTVENSRSGIVQEPCRRVRTPKS